MGKKGKKSQAGKPKKLTPKDIGKRLDVLVKKLEEETKDVDLFAPLPPTEDCAICFVPLPRCISEIFYQACCGNTICWACYKENEASINKQNEGMSACEKVALTCPFCRDPNPTTELEDLRQLQARCLKNDRVALTQIGDLYREGEGGIAKDDLKALNCYIRAVELGSPSACAKIGYYSYSEGKGVAINEERAVLFHRVGALRGDIYARHNVGCSEYTSFGNHEIGIRHWKIATEAGDQASLDKLLIIYNADGKMPGKEFITKEYLDFACRACHKAQEESKSEEREKYQPNIKLKKKLRAMRLEPWKSLFAHPMSEKSTNCLE